MGLTWSADQPNFELKFGNATIRAKPDGMLILTNELEREEQSLPYAILEVKKAVLRSKKTIKAVFMQVGIQMMLFIQSCVKKGQPKKLSVRALYIKSNTNIGSQVLDNHAVWH